MYRFCMESADSCDFPCNAGTFAEKIRSQFSLRPAAGSSLQTATLAVHCIIVRSAAS